MFRPYVYFLDASSNYSCYGVVMVKAKLGSRPRRALKPRTVGPWSQERRLEFIDFRLRWDGRLNRGDLTDFFGISVPQASLDIAKYLELAPKNLEYDRSSRVYLACARFRPLYPASAPERFLNELLASALGALDGDHSLLGFRPPMALVPSPGRTIAAGVLVALQRAIRERTGLRVLYQSLTRPEPASRTLSPHALAHDGFRWHVRAYCHARKAFRDFVIARILEVEGSAPAGLAPEQDVDWNARVKLVLAPHPKLSQAQRRVIELDYGMSAGQVELESRRALLFYVLRHLRLDGERDDTPEAQQIVLKNRAELDRERTKPDRPRVA